MNFSKKYKYLNYIPVPVNLESNRYDLVNDEEFCKPDGRTPLLLVTQYGVFPNDNYIGRKDYNQLEGLENQNVAFLARAYLSNREYFNIIELFLSQDTLDQIRDTACMYNWNLWKMNF